jgi:2-(1,2-epoxy-1,2-dihydrophenyl)acetyl-CoA isomerase
MSDSLLFDQRGGVATLTLNRPAARNALTTGLFLDMERMLLEVAADDAVRVVVLTGAGRGFSAGADLKPISEEELRRAEAPSFPGDLGGDILDRGNRCILRLRELAKPVLGSINGDAVGIGCSLVLATDLAIASEAARFGMVFSRIGLGPDGGASSLLRERVGTAKALELLFLGDLVDATEALRLGLVNRVVPAEELADATSELAERLAHGPTRAYGFAKQAVYGDASVLTTCSRSRRATRIAGRSTTWPGIRAFLDASGFGVGSVGASRCWALSMTTATGKDRRGAVSAGGRAFDTLMQRPRRRSCRGSR